MMLFDELCASEAILPPCFIARSSRGRWLSYDRLPVEAWVLLASL